jgi:ParB/RepB/Spo0J family partition protein
MDQPAMGGLPAFEIVPCNSIIIDREDRQRRVIDTTDLEPSIKQWGVVQPIILTRGLVLVAGERRLTASRRLGLEGIPAVFVDQLSPVELKIIELEENVKREDLDWRDRVRAVAQIHQIFCEADSEWDITSTAEKLGVTLSWASLLLRVARDLGDERVQQSGTAREAYNLLARRDQRATAGMLENLVRGVPLVPMPSSQPKPSETSQLQPTEIIVSPEPALVPHQIISANFLDWAPLYAGEKFNLIHCDFPYGTNLFSSNPNRTGKGLGQMGRDLEEEYEDSPEIFFTLLDCLLDNFNRVASLSCHLVFWLTMKHHREVVDRLRLCLPELQIIPFPLIWVKSDNSGIISDPRRRYRHVYETALFAHRGNRFVVKNMADAYSAPSASNRMHLSEKPEPMLRHFLSALVDEHTSLLDPTAGSGTALRAGESLGASRSLGLELSPDMANRGNKALQDAIRLRRAGR